MRADQAIFMVRFPHRLRATLTEYPSETEQKWQSAGRNATRNHIIAPIASSGAPLGR